jgi:hypothetical protein
MNLNLKEAEHQVLMGSQDSELMWNPYGLGKFANCVLLLCFKTWCLAGLDEELVWAMTEKAEGILVAVRDLFRREKR